MSDEQEKPPEWVQDATREAEQRLTSQLTADQEQLPPCPQMDWQQVVLNGGPPCFFVEGPQFCGRAERWQGHGNPAFHVFISLDCYVRLMCEKAERRAASRSTGQTDIEDAIRRICGVMQVADEDVQDVSIVLRHILRDTLAASPVEDEKCPGCGHGGAVIDTLCRAVVRWNESLGRDELCLHRCDFSRPAQGKGCPDPEINALTDSELAIALMNEFWATESLGSFKSHLLEEAIDRLRAAPRPVSEAAEITDEDSQVFYPGIVDQKTLSACLGTAELIIREPNPERVERFQNTKAKLIAQVKRYPLSFNEWNREHNSELTKE